MVESRTWETISNLLRPCVKPSSETTQGERAVCIGVFRINTRCEDLPRESAWKRQVGVDNEFVAPN